MDTERTYWQRTLSSPVSRRQLLRGIGLGGSELATAFLFACSGSNSTQKPAQTATSSAAGGAAAPATAAGQSTSAAQGTAAVQPKPGGTLRVQAYLEGPLNFDPFSVLDKRVQQYAMYVYDTVMSFTYGPEAKPDDFTPHPYLVESVETPDNTTYVFKVRPGVKFQNKPPVNGRTLVADDIVYSMKRRMDPQ